MRLELSRRTDLALRSLRILSHRKQRMARPALAAETGTSPDFLAKALAPLVHAGWLASGPGRGGGYDLAVDLSTVSIYRLIEITEGFPAGDRCVLRGGPCEADGTCALHEAWTAAREALRRELDDTTVAEHAEG